MSENDMWFQSTSEWYIFYKLLHMFTWFFFQLRCNHVIQRSLLFFMYINKSNFLEFVFLCLYYSPNQVQHDSIQMIWLYKKAIPLCKNKLVLIFLDFPKDPCNNGGYNRCDEVIGVKIYQLWFNIYFYVAR